jgi:hypothetical protein
MVNPFSLLMLLLIIAFSADPAPDFRFAAPRRPLVPRHVAPNFNLRVGKLSVKYAYANENCNDDQCL